MSLTDLKHIGRIIYYKVFLNLVLASDTALSSFSDAALVIQWKKGVRT